MVACRTRAPSTACCGAAQILLTSSSRGGSNGEVEEGEEGEDGGEEEVEVEVEVVEVEQRSFPGRRL